MVHAANSKIQALENEVIEGKEAANMANDKIQALESKNQRYDEEIRRIQTQLAQSKNQRRSTGRLKLNKAFKDNQKLGWVFTSQQVYFKCHDLFYTQCSLILYLFNTQLLDL